MTVHTVASVQQRIATITARFQPPATPFAATLATAASGDVVTPSVDATTSAPTLAPSHLPPAAARWAPHIARAAERHGLDPRLLTALVNQESGFHAAARSSAGAVGLTQLMPGTAAELGVDPTDPIANLDGGARYLRQQLDRFGSTRLALAAYNAGPGRVEAAGGVPPITETRRYVASVLATYTRLGGTP